MSSRVNTEQIEAANALLQLSRSDKQIVSKYYLRDRSKINQPKPTKQIYSTKPNAPPATLHHIIAAVATFDHLVVSQPKPIVSTRRLRDRSKLNEPDRLSY